MIALLVCVAAFAACYWAGRRSLGQGLVTLLAFGYFYGILRANLLTAFSHFIFDAGLLGLYASFRWSSPADANRSKGAQLWTILLIIWPIVLVPMPFQPLLISLVGLRGAIFFIPLLLLGEPVEEQGPPGTLVGTGGFGLRGDRFRRCGVFPRGGKVLSNQPSDPDHVCQPRCGGWVLPYSVHLFECGRLWRHDDQFDSFPGWTLDRSGEASASDDRPGRHPCRPARRAHVSHP